MVEGDKVLENRWCEFKNYHDKVNEYEFVIKPVFSMFISLGIRFNYEDPKRTTFKLEGDMRFGWPGIELLMCTVERNEPITLVWSLYHEHAHTTQPLQTKEQAVEGS